MQPCLNRWHCLICLIWKWSWRLKIMSRVSKIIKNLIKILRVVRKNIYVIVLNIRCIKSIERRWPFILYTFLNQLNVNFILSIFEFYFLIQFLILIVDYLLGISVLFPLRYDISIVTREKWLCSVNFLSWIFRRIKIHNS